MQAAARGNNFQYTSHNYYLINTIIILVLWRSSCSLLQSVLSRIVVRPWCQYLDGSHRTSDITTSHRHAEKCRVMLRDTWQLRWCCVTAKMMLRDSWGDAAWHVTAAAGDAAWHVTAAGCPRDLSCRNLTNQRLRRYGSQSHPVRYVMYCKTALFAVLSGCHIEMKCGCGLNPRFCFV